MRVVFGLWSATLTASDLGHGATKGSLSLSLKGEGGGEVIVCDA